MHLAKGDAFLACNSVLSYYAGNNSHRLAFVNSCLRLAFLATNLLAQVPARSGVICNGRNDGASGGKRRRSSGGKSRRVDFQGPTVDDALWYEGDKAPAAPSTSSPSLRPPPSGPSRPQHSSPASSRGAYQRTGNQGGNGRRGRGAREDDDEDEGDVRGWWEKPEERNLQVRGVRGRRPVMGAH